MTLIYLIRHGIAAPRGSHPRDADRPLTEEGTAKTRRAAAGLATLADMPLLLTSPLVRARQTADATAGAFDPPPEVRIEESLAGTGDYKAIAKAVGGCGSDEVGLVGHEPDMGRFASWLLAGRAGAVACDFKKAAVCCIECEGSPKAGQGCLLWFCPPRVLRVLGGEPTGPSTTSEAP